MQYLNPTFTVGGKSSKEYRDNWDRIFGKKDEPAPCSCGHSESNHVEKPGLSSFVCDQCACAHFSPQ